MNLKQTLAFIESLDGWLSSHEGHFLYQVVKQNKKGNIAEIGSWKGKSTICLAQGSLHGNKFPVYAIDPHKGEFSKGNGIGRKSPTYKTFTRNITKAGVEKIIYPLLDTSEGAAKHWRKSVGVLFIDGLHDYKHTKQDFSLWQKFVIKNGIIAFHDAFCGHEGPQKVINELLQNNNFSGFGVVGSIIYVKKDKAHSLLSKLNRYRHSLLIPLANKINKSQIPDFMKFFIIHRIIKLLLLNIYTFAVLFG